MHLNLKKLFLPVSNFFSNFYFKKKAIIVTLAFIIPFFFLSFVMFEHMFEEIRTIEKEKKSLRFIKVLKELMIKIQQHRGMEQGFLSGERSFTSRLKELEEEIGKLINHLKHLDRQEHTNFSTTIQRIEEFWEEVKKGDTDIEKSFFLHTKFIEMVIDFQKKIALDFGLFHDKNINNHYLIVSNFDTLPNIMEYLGVIRGLMTKVLTSKVKSIEERRRIQNLLILLYGELNTLTKAITHYASSSEDAKDIIEHFHRLKGDIGSFVDEVGKKIEVGGNAKLFFEYATKVIDTSEKFYHKLLQQFTHDLDQREFLLQWEIALLIFALLLISLIGTIIFLGFFYSISTPLERFQEAIKKISQGDYSVRVQVDTKDELKELATVFNDLILNLQRNINFLNGYKIALDSATLVTKGDLNGNITYANGAFLKISGYTREEILGKPHSIFRDPSVPKEIFKKMWQMILAKKVWKGILKIRNKEGRRFIMKTSIVPLFDEKGEIEEFIAVRVDITELIEAQEKIKRMLYFDNLTSLPNRVKLLYDCRKRHAKGIVLLNIEDFREFNDIYGYEGGNFILREIAKLLKNYQQKGIKVYKFPSDEFAIVFFRPIDKVLLDHQTTQIVEEIEKHTFVYKGCDVKILLRAGTALLDETSKRIDEVILDAETAIKEAKRSIRKIVHFSESIASKQLYLERLQWIEKIKKAIEEDRIEPYFQPIYNNRTKRVEKYEALMRMIDEEGKVISPFFFLDIAKKAKLYTQLTQIMIEKSLRYFEDRKEEISINISAQDLEDEGTYAFILERIKSLSRNKKVEVEVSKARELLHVHENGGIVIEFTESEEVENYELVATFNERIKELRNKIAIDDFGTGYSNFVYILNMGIDYLKIDGSLIKNILTDERSLTLVKAISDFSHELGLKTIAEFVSSEEIQEKITEIGVDYSQGYFISEPMPIEKVRRFQPTL